MIFYLIHISTLHLLLNSCEAKKRKANQHEREKVFMTSLKQVKETGEYRTLGRLSIH